MKATSAPAIGRRTDAGAAPLSFAQELIWLMDRASPGVTAWNVSRAYRIRGALDVTALRAALDALVARHAALRTTFVATGAGPRTIVRPPERVALQRYDLREYAEHGVAEAQRLVHAQAQMPFDLERAPLLRAMLVQLGDEDWLLSLDTHHIVSDSWTKSLVSRDLSELYRALRHAEPAQLPPLPLEYSDFAVWERDPAHVASLAPSLAYWREQLGGNAGIAPLLELPTDRARGATPRFEGAGRTATLARETLDALRRVAREGDATLYMTLLAGLATVLHRYSGQDDFTLGSPIAGRSHAETENVVGYFANTLVLRMRFADDPTFAQLLERVRTTALEAYEHQEVPAEALVVELQKEGRLSAAPLFNVIFAMEDTLPDALALDGTRIEPLEVDLAATKFDLTLRAAEVAEGIRLSLWYRTDLFSEAAADGVLAHLRTLLEAAAADPARRCSDLPLLSDAERRVLLAMAHGASAPIGPAPVHLQFEAAARRTPQALAVVDDERTYTYADVYAAATALAHALRARGIAAGEPVGLGLPRGGRAIAGLLGILGAGGAFVPLDPELPALRLATLAAESGIRLLVTDAALQSRFENLGCEVLCLPSAAAENAQEPRDGAADDAGSGADRAVTGVTEAVTGAGTADTVARVSLDDPAYVVFTSGSTGVPKGVRVTHRNLLNYTTAISARLGVSRTEPWSFATTSPLSVDLGYTAIFPALVSGGTLHIIGADASADSTGFAERMGRGIDVLKITPGHFAALADGAELRAVLPRRWLILGGEACPWNLVERVQRSGTCRILNHYGPTEATVGACTFAVGERDFGDARSATVPTGSPLGNVRCYVLDDRRELVPLGIAGELYVGGLGVARGYVNRPEADAERFVRDPFGSQAGGRLYRTGDRVRRLASGELEFLGRRDDQVKVRGFRVELGEIENVLVAHPGVARAAVLSRSNARGATLTAYVAAAAHDGVGSAGDVVAASANIAASSGCNSAASNGAAARTHDHVAEHANAAVNEATLRAWAEERLPDYVRPDAYVVLERLPLGPSGKVDRDALPELAGAAPASGDVAPRTPTEERVAAIWAELLGVERIGVTANFLALGFHSILAIRGLNELNRAFGVRVPLRSFFDSPTVAELAAVVDAEVERAEESDFARALATVEGQSSEVPRGGAAMNALTPR